MNGVLRHVKLKSPIQYQEAARIQDLLVRRLLETKSHDAKKLLPSTVLTMEMSPVYTTGRRERGLMSQDEIQALESCNASVVASLRGGQTTFHGPGQLVAYPILDIHQHRLRPKCYVDLLENTIIGTLAHYDLQSFKTENTGVWVSNDKKIAAIGVHLRRNITSHGIALNIATDLSFFDKIVACGLVDKQTTSMRQEGFLQTVEEVTDCFVSKLADRMHLVVDKIDVEDI